MKTITVETKKLKEVVNIAPNIEELLKKHPAQDGMMHLFLKHSTAALTTAYIEEGIDLDLIGALDVMIPHTITSIGKHHTHHFSHLPAHITASMLGPHLAVPIEKNKLILGLYQSLVMVELNGPRKREIVVDYKEKRKE